MLLTLIKTRETRGVKNEDQISADENFFLGLV